MATAPTVAYQANDDGSHSIGVKVGKTFVPFTSVSEGYFNGLKQSAEQAAGTTKDDSEDGDK